MNFTSGTCERCKRGTLVHTIPSTRYRNKRIKVCSECKHFLSQLHQFLTATENLHLW